MLHRLVTLGLTAVTALAATSTAFGQAAPALRTRNIIGTGLNYPIGATHAPSDKCRMFVIEKRGLIKVIDIKSPVPSVIGTFLDIDSLVLGSTTASGEQGLLGLAFHPDYWNNGYFFVYYTNTSGNTVLARYQVSANPNVATASSALIVMTFTQPFSNHNGGWIEFGPDGYLYMGIGDGGSANDPNQNGQNINSRLGKILRIEPNVAGNSPTFFNPPTNPYVGVAGDDAIYHIGLRNPWRNGFDRQTGDLFIADVGQNAREEIHFIPAGVGGLNLGWRCMEGFACTGLSGCVCNAASITKPIRDYTHVGGVNGGFCITGGYMYRGPAIPALDGFYFHADYTNSNTWVMRYTQGGGILNLANINAQITPSLQGTTVNSLASYGEDARGEIYIVKQSSTTTGGLFKVVAASGEVIWNDGDLNHDGVVNGADIAMVLGNWGVIGGDTNCDHTTDGADIATVLGNWTP